MYYEDIAVDQVLRRFFQNEPLNDFYPLSNSLEFIRSGHLQLIRKQDGSIVDLKGPAFFWMRKNGHYGYRMAAGNSEEKYIEHFFIDFTGERSDRIISALDELYPGGMFHPQDPEEVHNIFLRLLKIYRADWKSNLPEIGFLLEKLIYLAHDTAEADFTDPMDNYGLENIAEQLRSEPFREYDFAGFASQAGITYDHFRRIFRKKYRSTPKEYLHYHRMFRAAELLKQNMRIKEIVYSCNFKSLIDFSKMFKKYSGLSPREYRDQHRTSARQRERNIK